MKIDGRKVRIMTHSRDGKLGHLPTVKYTLSDLR